MGLSSRELHTQRFVTPEEEERAFSCSVSVLFEGDQGWPMDVSRLVAGRLPHVPHFQVDVDGVSRGQK